VAVSIPRPSYLDTLVRVGFKNGQQRWRSRCGSRIYTWDAFHGEIEVFNSRGRHIGVVHAITGATIKPAEKGRSIDVS
jgi:hypothetical protein